MEAAKAVGTVVIRLALAYFAVAAAVLLVQGEIKYAFNAAVFAAVAFYAQRFLAGTIR